MKAFFACGDAVTAKRMLRGRRALVSFAYVGTSWLPVDALADIRRVTTELMIDSGAFTAWQQKRPIALDEYIGFLITQAPYFEWAIALDVIEDAEASMANFLSMVTTLPGFAARIVPVWHEGDPDEHLDEYVRRARLVALGRTAGRRSIPKTFEFYDHAFNRHPQGAFHALGNASAHQLEPYPFKSCDSTGWQRDAAYSNAARWPFNRCTRETRMRAYIEAIETIEHRPPQQLALTWSPLRSEVA